MIPVKEEVAWSRKADHYAAVLNGLASLKNALRQVEQPGVRNSTHLLDLMPENTVVYAALPNMANSIVESHRIIQERISQNAALRDWWEKEQSGRAQNMDRVVETIRQFGAFLGDEIYIMAEADIPPARHYSDFPQMENGVGMVRTFLTQFNAALRTKRRDQGGVRGTICTGKVFFPPADQNAARPLVKLRNSSSQELTGVVDRDGKFRFIHLRPDQYTVVVDGGDAYQTAYEMVTIGNAGPVPAQGNPFDYAIPFVYEVQIYLKPKRNGVANQPEATRAALADIAGRLPPGTPRPRLRSPHGVGELPLRRGSGEGHLPGDGARRGPRAPRRARGALSRHGGRRGANRPGACAPALRGHEGRLPGA